MEHLSVLSWQTKSLTDSTFFFVADWSMQQSTGLLRHHRVPSWWFVESILAQARAQIPASR
jgi:hypothetical protein